MEIKGTLKYDVTPTDYIIIRAYTTRDRATVVTQQVFAPPHLNPRAFVLTVPTAEPHIVIIRRSPDGVADGVIDSSYMEEPDLYAGTFSPDITLVANGGVVDIDPVADSMNAPIPSLNGKDIARIFRSSTGRYIYKDRVPAEWAPRSGGGFDLLPPQNPFYPGEILTLEFAPDYNNNIGNEIIVLTQNLQAHILDTSNPHFVTKTQVGLGNLPNAKSDSITLNDSNVLATSKAVNDLRLAIQNPIIYANKQFLGDISGTQAFQIVHNKAVAGSNYLVAGSMLGTSGGSFNDVDISWVIHTKDPNSFFVVVREYEGDTQSLWFEYALIKYSV